MPEHVDELFQVLPWAWPDTSIHVRACKALSHRGVPTGLEELQKALGEGAQRWRLLDTIRVTEALLDVAFFGDWVEGRYWSHSTERPITLETAVAEMLHGNTNPYEERTYHNYGQFRDGKPEFRVRCSGYDEGAAAQIAERIVSEGSGAFSDTQLQAVRTVVNCEPLWTIPAEWLGIWGLPTDRRDLAQLVEP